MTNSIITVDGSTTEVNTSGEKYICYAFHSVEGYSKMGLYKGNGNASGAFTYTGFRPAWIMIKRTDSSDGWSIQDFKRDAGINDGDGETLYADTNGAESASNAVHWDMLSNGFKMRSSNGFINGSGGSYLYLAFAEAPIKYANAR